MREAKILQKDLPFDRLTKGTVVSMYNQEFIIECGETWYDGKLHGSSNGIRTFEKEAQDLLKVIWNNEEWFKPVELKVAKYKRTSNSITIYFDSPADLEDIELLAKGIAKTLRDNYKKTVETMGWTDELVDIIF